MEATHNSHNNSFSFPFLPQSEYDKIKHHPYFHIICHITKEQFSDLFYFFDISVDTQKEILAAKLNMAFDKKAKLKILRKESGKKQIRFLKVRMRSGCILTDYFFQLRIMMLN